MARRSARRPWRWALLVGAIVEASRRISDGRRIDMTFAWCDLDLVSWATPDVPGEVTLFLHKNERQSSRSLQPKYWNLCLTFSSLLLANS
jgi:hypothetical protein